ncbi:IS481 family transposase [Kordiimonas pumila]|uniref:IS481 family transposase n=1 Tax=Kordiimonas pumila TaxID=2161677 RepID=A0ABV7D606_9PROT|nr:IS481 family transposase [Kordiimonas pumila]
MTNDEKEIRRKLAVLKRTEEVGSAAKAYRYYGIPKTTYFRWKKAYRAHGEQGLINKKQIAKRHPNQTPDEVVEKILYLRQKYHLGPIRIMWYMARYHDLRVSDATISRVLKRHGVSRLPRNVGRRKIHTKRYQKQVPGHHIQMDVKFLIFKGKDGKKIKRYQYTAIDDATRVRALKIYKRHTQKSAIDFVDYIIDKFPFRIQQIRTDRGHEFQSQFHWYVEDKGIRHVYIKARTPQLNGKVERSHRSDQQEFYQLLCYKDDVDLEAKLAEWEAFYNFARPHGAHGGKAPYEKLL